MLPVSARMAKTLTARMRLARLKRRSSSGAAGGVVTAVRRAGAAAYSSLKR